MPSNVLPLHLKQTFPPIIWIFTEGESDGIEFRLPFKIFSTLHFSQIFPMHFGSKYKDLLTRSYFFKSVCVLSGFSLNPFRFMPVKTRLGDLAFLIVKILVCTTDSKNTKWSARSTLETLWPCLGLLVQPFQLKSVRTSIWGLKRPMNLSSKKINPLLWGHYLLDIKSTSRPRHSRATLKLGSF